jgi:hypothetical protein
MVPSPKSMKLCDDLNGTQGSAEAPNTFVPGRTRVHISRLGSISYSEAIAFTKIALATAGSFNVFGQPPPVAAAASSRRFGSYS